MDNADRWYFSKDQLANTPSRKCGISESRELSFRQQAANFIQDMGQRLQVNQLCINTAIVYMHRFYVFHSFTEIHRNKLSLSALFLAAKVEEQPRKLEHLIKVAHACLHKDLPPLDVRSETYQEKMFEVVAHENILLQTLGFVLAIEHPHTYVVKVCQLVKASKDLAQTSYIMATTSLHMTTMCLMYKPTLVACVCIHLACKWSDWRIEKCSEGRDWFFYVDKTVTNEKLEVLTDKFIAIMETSPHRFKKKFGQKEVLTGPRSLMDEPSTSKAGMNIDIKQEFSPGPSGIPYDFKDYEDPNTSYKEKSPTKQAPAAKPSTPNAPSSCVPPAASQLKKPIKVETQHSISLDVYREKKEKERQQGKVPAPVEPSMHQPTNKKPQHAFHDAERLTHRPSSKHPEMPQVKEKNKVPEIKMEHSTSTNKINHQMGKVNSDSSYYKEKPNATAQEKFDMFPYEKVDALLQNKISPIPHEIPISFDRVDYTKQEIMDFISDENKSEEYNKQEKAVRVNQGRMDAHKHSRVDSSRYDKTDAVMPESIEHVKQEKPVSKSDRAHMKQQRMDTQHEKSDYMKHERNDNIKQEKVEHPKHEKIDHVKYDKVDYPKHEKVENPKYEKLDHDHLKHERIDHPKHEKVDHQRHEKMDHQKHDKADHHKVERTDHSKYERDQIKQERLDQIKQEKIDYMRPQKSDHMKHDKTDIKHEKTDHMKYEKIDHIKHEKVDHIKHEKVDIKAENRNSIPLTINTSQLSRSSHKEESIMPVETVKKERREKHKKHSSHSKERSSSNHIEHAPPAGIKVKIPKTIINLSGKVPESSQKYSSPSKPESPKRSLKIKLPKPPEEARIVKPIASTSIKLVITKDKSGSGSYSTSQKNDREKESRKRAHSNSIPDGNGKTLYDMPPAKHQKLDHSQKSHHSNSSGGKSSKSSRHSSHRSSSEHSQNDSGYSIPQYPANGNNALNPQSYSQNYMYNFPPPPQPPKMKAYAMATGKTNSNPPLPPPLPPPPPPPPE